MMEPTPTRPVTRMRRASHRSHQPVAADPTPARPPGPSGLLRGASTLTFQGGLGNQLFQFAFGHALRADGLDLAADTVRCRGYRPLVIGGLLGDWPRVARPAGLVLVARQKGAERLGREPARRFVIERGAGYDRSLEELARIPGRHLVGYFQSPLYFRHAEAAVQHRMLDFLRGHLTDRGRQVVRDVLAGDDVAAIHVRRGDYVTSAVASDVHGVLPPGYYETALHRVDRLGLRRLWFSDDLPWVQEHLARPGDVVCTPDLTTAAAGEIAIMASCRARVIANSSFSWWGGYLGRPSSADRPVIAPRRWFADGREPVGLVPPQWVRL